LKADEHEKDDDVNEDGLNTAVAPANLARPPDRPRREELEKMGEGRNSDV
jgi:hypothetical protein